MASIFGVELNGDLRRRDGLIMSASSQRIAGGDCLVTLSVYEDGSWESLFILQETRKTEPEAIAALEAKVRRLPGVLAALNGVEEVDGAAAIAALEAKVRRLFEVLTVLGAEVK